jgi:hypothetical protein
MNHTLFNDSISASVSAAQKNVQGLELLWQAGPVWPRHRADIISDRRPPEERRTSAPGQTLSHDAARVCAGSESPWRLRVCMPNGGTAEDGLSGPEPETDQGRPGSPWMRLDP